MVKQLNRSAIKMDKYRENGVARFSLFVMVFRAFRFNAKQGEHSSFLKYFFPSLLYDIPEKKEEKKTINMDHIE